MELTDETVEAIQRIHAEWIDLEVAGDTRSLMALCAEDVELRAPGAEPVTGKAAVLAWLAVGTAEVHQIEITDLCLSGSNRLVHLSARFKTTFSQTNDPARRQVAGCHLWELQKRADRWLVVLVSWTAEDFQAATGVRSTDSAI